MNTRAAEALRKLKRSEVVSQTAGSETAGTVCHVAAGAISGQAVQRARSPSDKEAIPADIEREARRRLIRHITHRAEVQGPSVKYVGGRSIGEGRIDQIIGTCAIEISGKQTARFS